MNDITGFWTYFLLANTIGFTFYLIYKILGPGLVKNIINIGLYLVAVGGGSFGMALAILIFDRKARKDGLTLKVFAFMSLFIESIIYLLINKDLVDLNLDFIRFFRSHLYLLAYIVVINIVTFLAFAYDKYRAKKGGWRIKNIFLLGLSFIGGSLGGLLGMSLTRHKSRKSYYRIGLPLMVLMQVLILVYFMN